MLGKEVVLPPFSTEWSDSGCAVVHPKPHSKVQLELKSPHLLFFSIPYSTHYPELWGKFIFRSL